MKRTRTDRRGFTLVELIVVLVILAILAASIVPALTGYIDKAKEKTLIAEARGVWTAAQAAASECYALNYDGFDAENCRHSCMINGRKVTGLGRVTNATLQDEQKNHHTTDLNASKRIGQQVLCYLDSEDYATARYRFEGAWIPSSGSTIGRFFQLYPKESVAIQIFYDRNGKVVALTFGRGDLMVTMFDGQAPACVRDGRFL